MIKQNYIYLIGAILIASIAFCFSYGLKTLDPTNINWLMSAYHDWGTHYLGWSFYRTEAWTFPLGNITNYNYPVGTNVGFTDSIPLLAFIFKIFNFLLPEDFQYFGIWILFCSILSAIYAYKIFNLFNLNKIISLIGVAFIVTCPTIIFRGMHPALCAHWLILGSFYYYFIKSNTQNVIKINFYQVLLLFLSALISPYMTAIIAGFNIILPIKNYYYDRSINFKKLLFFPFLSFASVLIIWLVFGLLSFSNGTNLDIGNIYGAYTFNLNSFFNSFGFYSKFLPHLGMVTDRQHEGFAYLGMGMIVSAFIALLYFIFKIFQDRKFFKNRGYLPLYIYIVFIFLFAVSNIVTYGTEVLFTVEIPNFVLKLGNIFRANGRFIWPVYYFIFIISIVAISKIRGNDYIKITVLLLLLCLQIYDTQNLITARTLQSGSFHTKLQDEKWIPFIKNFDEVVSYPPFTNNLNYSMDYQDLSFLALKSGKPITNSYVARDDIEKSKAYKDTLATKLNSGEIKKGQLFVTTAKFLNDFKVFLYKDNVQIQKFDNFIFIYSKDQKIVNNLPMFSSNKTFIDSLSLLYKKNILTISKLQLKETKSIKFNVEGYQFKNKVLSINGWAYKDNKTDITGDSIFISLTNKDKSYIIPANIIERPDLLEMYKDKNLKNAGFNGMLFLDKIPELDYTVGIVIKEKNGTYNYAKSDKETTARYLYKKPNVIGKLPKDTPFSSNIERIIESNNQILISGWAAIKGQDSSHKVIAIVFSNGAKNYSFDTNLVLRNDVTTFFNDKLDYNNSGFNVKIQKSFLPTGDYKIGLIITDNQMDKQYYHETDKSLKL